MFGAVKLTKNAVPDKYKCSGYGIGVDSRSEVSLPDGSMSKDAIIFGVDMSSCVHIDNKKIYFLILGKGETQGLDNTTLSTEAQYSIKFSRSMRNFCLSLHYNRSNGFYLLMLQKQIFCSILCQFKINLSEIRFYKMLHKRFQKISQLRTWKNRIKWICLRIFCWL